MIGAIIGGAASVLSSGIGAGMQTWQNKKNREEEERVRQATWAREDKLRAETHGREDNAVQRRAEDMRLAGINPLLAAGDPAQASAGQTSGGTTQSQSAPSLDGLA